MLGLEGVKRDELSAGTLTVEMIIGSVSSLGPPSELVMTDV
jgi:hypothetical protein